MPSKAPEMGSDQFTAHTSASDSPTRHRRLPPCSVLGILVRYEFFRSPRQLCLDKMSRICPVVPWRRINRSNKRFSAVAARWRLRGESALLLVVTFTQNGDNCLCERGKSSISSLWARLTKGHHQQSVMRSCSTTLWRYKLLQLVLGLTSPFILI